MGVVSVGGLKPSNSGKEGSLRPSSSNSQNGSRPICGVLRNLTIEVGAASFAVDKSALVSRSGRIRRLLEEEEEARDWKEVYSRVNLGTVPGGPDALDLVAKFCYGMDVELKLSNAAMMHCAAHYLEMSEEIAEQNLESQTEAYLKWMLLSDDVAVSTLITLLRHCETLLPVAEEINLVNRIINAIADKACKHQLTLSKIEPPCSISKNQNANTETTTETTASDSDSNSNPDSIWWGDSVARLKLEFFQRVMSGMKARGLDDEVICRILINYARTALQGLRDPQLLLKDSRLDAELEMQKKQRVAAVEAIVGLLPPLSSTCRSSRRLVPMAFLSSLLKQAIAASASIACRSDLERRMGLQLDQATLEDILIPSKPTPPAIAIGGPPRYDTDSIARIFSIFLNLDHERHQNDDDPQTVCDLKNNPESPKQGSILKVAKLLDTYLAEIALDSNLPPLKFIALAELLPDHSRVVTDGLYQAVDICLKVHPNMKDSDRYRLCKTIDCQKLTQEACSHAAQNERLPVQMAVQVLYFEQNRLRSAMNGGGGSHSHSQFFNSGGGGQFHFQQRIGSSGGRGDAMSAGDNYASVRRENRELKLEVARMRMRLTDLEKDHVSMKEEMVKTKGGNATRFFNSFSKTFTKKLNGRFRSMGSRPNSEARLLFKKRWRPFRSSLVRTPTPHSPCPMPQVPIPNPLCCLLI